VSDYEALGGHDGVTRLVEAYVDRFFADFIIGYLFEGRDRARIVTHEVEFAAAHLGGPKDYTGRPIDAAHQPLRINRGHFRRRLAILRTVLNEHGVDSELVDRWVAFEQRLEAAIVDGTDCAP
jgi:hemoglobin